MEQNERKEMNRGGKEEDKEVQWRSGRKERKELVRWH